MKSDLHGWVDLELISKMTTMLCYVFCIIQGGPSLWTWQLNMPPLTVDHDIFFLSRSVIYRSTNSEKIPTEPHIFNKELQHPLFPLLCTMNFFFFFSLSSVSCMEQSAYIKKEFHSLMVFNRGIKVTKSNFCPYLTISIRRILPYLSFSSTEHKLLSMMRNLMNVLSFQLKRIRYNWFQI